MSFARKFDTTAACQEISLPETLSVKSSQSEFHLQFCDPFMDRQSIQWWIFLVLGLSRSQTAIPEIPRSEKSIADLLSVPLLPTGHFLCCQTCSSSLFSELSLNGWQFSIHLTQLKISTHMGARSWHGWAVSHCAINISWEKGKYLGCVQLQFIVFVLFCTSQTLSFPQGLISGLTADVAQNGDHRRPSPAKKSQDLFSSLLASASPKKVSEIKLSQPT